MRATTVLVLFLLQAFRGIDARSYVRKRSTATNLADIEVIKPVSEVEDRAYWMEYGKNDIRNRIQLQEQVSTKVAKNVILLIGDGMGVQTGTMSRIFKGQQKGNSGEEDQLIWESFPNTGFSKTYNANFQVTDSAGAATALLSGVKTSFGVLGIDSSISRNSCDPTSLENAKIKNMFHWAMEAGKEIGLVTTTRVTHATPGAAYAHITDRNWEHDEATGFKGRPECGPDVAKQMIYSDVGQKLKVIMGGGKRNFLTKSEGGKRADQNLLDEFERLKEENQKTYRYLQTKADMEQWATEGMLEDDVLGLFASSHLPYEADLTESSPEPCLNEMAFHAVNKMEKDNNEGYFLLIESGRIDHAHHENLAQKAMVETVEFDKTVKEILDLVDTTETLIIVTADHSHAVTINGYPVRGNNILGESFQDPLTSSEFEDGTKLAYATISYANGPGFHDFFTGDPIVPWKDMRTMNYTDKDFKFPAMMPGPEKEESHGGEDVPIFATGPMSQLVIGFHEENYIAHVMAYSSCVGPYKDNCDEEKRCQDDQGENEQ